jgi:polyhydroxyalkanoate synthesis regulator phasin
MLKSTDDLYKQDEIEHQSKESLSEMLDQMEIARESEDDDDSNDLKYLVTIHKI